MTGVDLPVDVDRAEGVVDRARALDDVRARASVPSTTVPATAAISSEPADGVAHGPRSAGNGARRSFESRVRALARSSIAAGCSLRAHRAIASA